LLVIWKLGALDKVVLITGSSSGIGRACAIKAAQQGAGGLSLHYLGDKKTKRDVESLVQEISNLEYSSGRSPPKTISVPGDISDPSTSTRCVKESAEAFGRIG
jgi:L-rhamnose 1-dehydrogenase